MINSQAIYIALEIWGVFISALCLINIYIGRDSIMHRKNLTYLQLVGLFLMLADSLTRLNMGTSGEMQHVIVVVGTLVGFVCNFAFMAGFMWLLHEMLFKDFNDKLPVGGYIVYGLSIVGILSEIVNLKFKYYYYIDDMNNYCRLPAFQICQVIALVGLFIMFIIFMRYKSRLERRVAISVTSYFVLPIFAVIFTMLYRGTALQNLALVTSTQLFFITEQLGLHNKLKNAYEESRKANSYKDRFLSHISHDVRTPLNAITGMVDIALNNLDDPKKIEECCQNIKSASYQLLMIFNDTLNISRINTGDIILKEDVFNMYDMLRGGIDYINNHNSQKQVNVSYSIPDKDKLGYYIGSITHIQQVFVNIFDNAYKYNVQNGKINFECRILDERDKSVRFQFLISDTGIGMSEDFLKHIYEPFTQEDDDVRTKYEGSGLGLAMVKQLIDAMGGRITVTSKKGAGTTVAIELTFKKALNEQIPGKGEAVVNDCKTNTLEGKKVLIVEDNEINAMVLGNILEAMGGTYDLAENGQIALDTFKNSPEECYSYIFMDIMMPVMDGIEATKQIRHLNRKDAAVVPIVAVTASTSEADITNVKLAGANICINKPVSLEEMITYITTKC